VAEPRRSTLTFWGQARDVAPLEWDWVRGQLEAAEDYWLVTVSASGRPAARPVWGTWHEDALWLSVGSTTHHRNLEARSEVEVHLEAAQDVVILEGGARLERDAARLESFCAPYNAKYRWNFTATTTGPIVVVTPRVVRAWRTVPTTEMYPGMAFPSAAGRWTFEERA
jgi:hypothetical protein